MGSLGTVRQPISARNVLNRVSSTCKQVLCTNDFASTLRRFATLFASFVDILFFYIKKLLLFIDTRERFPEGKFESEAFKSGTIK